MHLSYFIKEGIRKESLYIFTLLIWPLLRPSRENNSNVNITQGITAVGGGEWGQGGLAEKQNRSYEALGQESYWPSNISETLTSDWAAECVCVCVSWRVCLRFWKTMRTGCFGFLWKPIKHVSLGTDHQKTPVEFTDQSQAVTTELTPLPLY